MQTKEKYNCMLCILHMVVCHKSSKKVYTYAIYFYNLYTYMYWIEKVYIDVVYFYNKWTVNKKVYIPRTLKMHNIYIRYAYNQYC